MDDWRRVGGRLGEGFEDVSIYVLSMFDRSSIYLRWMFASFPVYVRGTSGRAEGGGMEGDWRSVEFSD